MRRRQFSEPAPFTRDTSERASPMRKERPGAVPEEDGELSDNLEDGQEPEQEIDPNWRLMGRQETEKAWAAASGKWGRMETEQNWPSWGLPVAQVPPTDPNTSYANGLWLFQMPGFPGAGNGPWPMPPPNGPDMDAPGANGSQPAPGAASVPVPPVAEGEMPASWASTTTVMMRNLPNKYTQHMLLEELNASGFLGTFDFMYLPIDPDTNANRGYAFINFTDPTFAWMLKISYEGRKMNSFNSDKVVSVAPAALQGFEANYAHYSTSRVNRGDPSARPLFLRESTMKTSGQKPAGSRRRGGRRSSGSLIDLATREQHHAQKAQQQSQVAPPPPAAPAPAPTGAIPAQTAPPDAAASTDGGQPRFCPFCGGKCQTHFRFCQFCGASLNLVSGSS